MAPPQVNVVNCGAIGAQQVPLQRAPVEIELGEEVFRDAIVDLIVKTDGRHRRFGGDDGCHARSRIVEVAGNQNRPMTLLPLCNGPAQRGCEFFGVHRNGRPLLVRQEVAVPSITLV